jgi:hypothetical protein
MKEQIRSFNEVTSDDLFPPDALLGFKPGTEARLNAVAHVLRQIPKKAYRSLSEKSREFEWFIPTESDGACVRCFRCTVPEIEDFVAMAKILYLPPDLESRDFPVLVATVAHELAHIFLNHNAMFNSSTTYAKQEREAWRTVRAWGFEKEELARAKFYKKYHREKSRLLKESLSRYRMKGAV